MALLPPTFYPDRKVPQRKTGLETTYQPAWINSTTTSCALFPSFLPDKQQRSPSSKKCNYLSASISFVTLTWSSCLFFFFYGSALNKGPRFPVRVPSSLSPVSAIPYLLVSSWERRSLLSRWTCHYCFRLSLSFISYSWVYHEKLFYYSPAGNGSLCMFDSEPLSRLRGNIKPPKAE